MNKRKTSIELKNEQHKYTIESIRRFFSDELDEDIGDLKAGQVLDFILREVAPSIYNQAMEDAQAYISERLMEMVDVNFKREFEFWKKR